LKEKKRELDKLKNDTSRLGAELREKINNEIAQSAGNDSARDIHLMQFAQKYSLVNFDDAPKSLQTAFLLTQQGYIDSARKFLSIGYVSEAAKINAAQSAVNIAKSEYMPKLKFLIDLDFSNFATDSAGAKTKILLSVDSTDAEGLLDYATFLNRKNYYDSSIIYYF